VIQGPAEVAALGIPLRVPAGGAGFELNQHHRRLAPQVVKRSFDLALALPVFMLLSPFLLAIAVLTRLTSKGPVFYGQRRIGRNGREFIAWKFRTMVQDADRVLEEHLRANPELRDEWDLNHKLRDDPRITSIGKVLRKFSLDEFPQLWNVLCGEMSIVGPRPIVRSEADRYGRRFALYQRVPPGITGLWQISGRNNTTYDERVRLDEYYVRHWSMLLDLYILLRTVKTVVSAEGAY
jgi:Undecaprenyl-phosphate galactose phosphotransferase WbaP